jgi:hypothetical protein
MLKLGAVAAGSVRKGQIRKTADPIQISNYYTMPSIFSLDLFEAKLKLK